MPRGSPTELADSIRGTGTVDVLDGLGGDDVILGMGGDDILRGGMGNDSLDGGRGNDSLFGDAGDDILLGGAGADTLQGGYGADQLTGGSGADLFRFTNYLGSTSLPPPGGLNVTLGIDTIADFVPGEDQIDLSGIDAIWSTAGVNEAFTFIGAEAFSNVEGQLRYEYDNVGERLILLGDMDGDGLADITIYIQGPDVFFAGLQEIDFWL